MSSLTSSTSSTNSFSSHYHQHQHQHYSSSNNTRKSLSSSTTSTTKTLPIIEILAIILNRIEDQENEDSFSMVELTDYFSLCLVSKVFYKAFEQKMYKRLVHHVYFGQTLAENLLPISNWKRCYMILGDVFHNKDWSLCPMCLREPLGVITSTKQLACFDDEYCKFKLSLRFDCNQININNNQYNNNQYNNQYHKRYSVYKTTNSLNRIYNPQQQQNNNNNMNQMTIGSSINQQQQQQCGCLKCKFKCKLCKTLVQGDMVSWKSLAKEQEKTLHLGEDAMEEDEDDDDDQEEDQILIKCERCVNLFRDIHTSDDTIFTLEDYH
ncbi:hypothetical protein DFA_09479 [Cavenderia fasciculata]|uniref:Uncharacterized protein n=1 Tax=Cavenderia fasciculata TaxID=261658 RepID=F4Q7R1_CACFS|nr:uncharacterized protein DFA_09479 [Cavenderia fasciculata]EGG15811.1 hypothetical protein DFA_09479 [Cavenderia fasciculata]|eukprot:XP_004352136.1 hypothetical protein DFA_09479 [Cavenderia fasciculata]